ncbi:MAG TPA: zinc ribbon domain-containing protein [Candidatus Acidoferrum sp.]|nr:zinc ribbon domain-containing protein [Candidatus Acidoferrum sp.]
MPPKNTLLTCPQCGKLAARGQKFCGKCNQPITSCQACTAINLVSSNFCHNCGRSIRTTPLAKERQEPPKPSLTPPQEMAVTASPTRMQPGRLPSEQPKIERLQLCLSCKKPIGSSEKFCRFCGTPQKIITEPAQTILDPHTLKISLLMLSRVTEAKEHSEYSTIDQLTTTIGEVALGKNKPHDAQELTFSDQLRLLTLVFEYTRDKVNYKGEVFGEYVRWPWETIKTGGDCDCKVVLLATMLSSLAFRRMHFLVLPGGTYLDSIGQGEKRIQGHALLEVELVDGSRMVPVRLDPSCMDCDVDDIADSIKPFLQNFYRVPIILP